MVGGFTIKRFIAEVTLRSSGGVGVSAFGSFGVTVAPQSAAAALPNAITDLVDWYWLKNFWLRDTGGDAMVRYPVDLRSGRKVRGEDRTMFFTVTNNAGSGGTLEFSIDARMWIQP